MITHHSPDVTPQSTPDQPARAARKLRIQCPGAIYHVLNRGGCRERICDEEADRQRFLGTLTGTCRKTAWQVHAYGLRLATTMPWTGAAQRLGRGRRRI